ncbi:MAG: DUF4012 domain-containing protein [Gordonia sp. (in: high G+C Gram-positive bacteria)]
MEDQKGSWPRRLLRSRLFVSIGVIAVLVIAALVWLAVSVVAVKGDVESARTAAAEARSQVLAGDEGGAQQAAESAAVSSKTAADRTHGIVWSAVAWVPWLGSPLRSVQQMSDAVSDYASQVLVPSAKLASVLSPNKIRNGATINTVPIAAAQPQLAALAAKSQEIGKRVGAIAPSWSSAVAQARTTLKAQVEDASATLNGSNVAAQLVPGMLGKNGPRNYFLAVQTPSESRGTGGLVGGFGILNAVGGRITAVTLGANSVLKNPATPQIDLGEQYGDIYSSYRPYTDWRNNNLSPDFRDAAQIWIANWKAQTGQHLDGAVAVDPVALSYVLAAIGPVTLPNGEKITADNVIPITLSTSYVRFPADDSVDNHARKAYLQTISQSVIDKLSHFHGSMSALLKALGKGASERRIMVYSTNSDEQRILETTDLAHQISATDAPYLQVALGNAAGNKIDYYLRRDITYTSGACTAGTRGSTVTVKLTNTLTNLSLPDYVIGHGGARQQIPKGTAVVNVELLLTKGAVTKQLTVDGMNPLYVDATLHDRPYAAALVRIAPGQTSTLTLTYDEPTSAHGQAQVPIQPLVDHPKVTVDVPVCR